MTWQRSLLHQQRYSQDLERLSGVREQNGVGDQSMDHVLICIRSRRTARSVERVRGALGRLACSSSVVGYGRSGRRMRVTSGVISAFVKGDAR